MALALRRPNRESGEPVADRPAAHEEESEARPAARPGRSTRVAAAGVAAAAGAVLVAAARVLRVLAGVAALVLVVAILLRVLSANPANTIVKDIHDLGNTLAGPFKNIFTPKDPKAAIAVNWGLAAVVYVLVGLFLASLIDRLAVHARASRSRAVAA